VLTGGDVVLEVTSASLWYAVLTVHLIHVLQNLILEVSQF